MKRSNWPPPPQSKYQGASTVHDENFPSLSFLRTGCHAGPIFTLRLPVGLQTDDKVAAIQRRAVRYQGIYDNQSPGLSASPSFFTHLFRFFLLFSFPVGSYQVQQNFACICTIHHYLYPPKPASLTSFFIVIDKRTVRQELFLSEI